MSLHLCGMVHMLHVVDGVRKCSKQEAKVMVALVTSGMNQRQALICSEYHSLERWGSGAGL